MNYQNKVMPYQYDPYMQFGDRQFVFPFLTGALVGGAAVGLTRPRPIYNVAPNYGMAPYYRPGAPYYNNSYSYYVPYRPY